MKRKTISIVLAIMFTLAIALPIAASQVPSSWAISYIDVAIEADLVPYTLQTNFQQAATRAEFATLAVALYEKLHGTVSGRISFLDTDDENVQKAAYIGIIVGVGGNRFAPNDNITREQAAVMVSRLSSVVGYPLPSVTAAFADNDSIAQWAIESVGQVQAVGIMAGVGNNRFAPQDVYTREQSIVSLMRLYNFVSDTTAVTTNVVVPTVPIIARDFPSLHITSELHPFEQEREFWHPGALSLTSANDDWNFDNVNVRLRGRGNSTWIQTRSKRPLRIRFETPRIMFDSGYAHSDWILLANAFDHSLLRTHFAFTFADLLGGTGFVPSAQFIHLYINGQYVGVYQLVDERNVAPGRGDIVVDPDPAISEYWLELDMRTTDFFRVNGRWYDIRYPSGNVLTDEHIDYAYQYIQSVSEAIRSRDWQKITQLIDVPSFISFYIMHEITVNADLRFSSLFMQILGQGEERRLRMGPFWDFDLSMGNVSLNRTVVENYFPYNYEPYGIWAAVRHYWFANLLQVPEFHALVLDRWNDVVEYEFPKAVASIEYMVTNYRVAFERNFEVHDVLGRRGALYPSPSRYQIDTFIGQVEFLVDWLNRRVEWLNNFKFDILEYVQEDLTDSSQWGFPSLRITSELHPFEQEREFWHTGVLSLISDNENWNFSNVDVRLRGRGNSTWLWGRQKRPLRIRFETPQPMFDSGYAHRDWILLANAFDNSLLRTHFAFTLAEALGGTGFVPSAQFVHLYINEEYVGVYQVVDERDIAPGRGEVIVDSDPAISEYWLEMDHRTRDFFRINGLWYDIRFPSGNHLTDDHVEYVHQFLLAVSEAIRSQDWQEITQHIDVPSFVSFYIVHELTMNRDLAFSSLFMQILGQGENRRLRLGPFWDFDLSMGNAIMNGTGRNYFPYCYNPEGIWAGWYHYWFVNLMQVPEFRTLVISHWNDTVQNEIANAIVDINFMATNYRYDFERNFEAQPVLGRRWRIYPSPPSYQIDTFAGQAEFLIDWLNRRVEWLNYYLNEGR